ncbi:hypothetical protein [Natronosalvus caseinilyticus]|uniref:hypothetical protein n=1 Tax=Natronosalvus caseinilyticus TaxID=2953747 RepID=UPI0028AD98A0|nr:hypothetical protein [Natronosalvus caseinilyticus]
MPIGIFGILGYVFLLLYTAEASSYLGLVGFGLGTLASAWALTKVFYGALLGGIFWAGVLTAIISYQMGEVTIWTLGIGAGVLVITCIPAILAIGINRVKKMRHSA